MNVEPNNKQKGTYLPFARASTLVRMRNPVDAFTVVQANTLYSIASQCPMEGGNAVYAARSMYRLINDTVFFDDQLICMQHGIIVKSIHQMDPNMTGVVPNPAKDQATLLLERPLEETGSFVLFNAVGKEVMRLPVPPAETRLPFSTGSLATGLYHYRVVVEDRLVGQGKWAILR